MIHSSVENLLLNIRCTLDANLRNLGVPLSISLLAYGVEVGIGNLGVEVKLCTLRTCRREGYLNANLLTSIGVEVYAVVEAILANGLELGEGLRELDDEVDLLVV